MLVVELCRKVNLTKFKDEVLAYSLIVSWYSFLKFITVDLKTTADSEYIIMKLLVEFKDCKSILKRVFETVRSVHSLLLK